jgi:peptidyl-tRNA hydrolase
MSSKVLQYVVVRKDLLPAKKMTGTFSTGAIISQGCHAATAAITKTLDAPQTQSFLAALEDMTVCVLGVENGAELEGLADVLRSNRIPFHLWIEKPESIPTALATAPVDKDTAYPYLSHLKLLR